MSRPSPAGSQAQLLDLLRNRVSPLEFDEGHTITEADVDLLLEAARRAPSAGNSQPWAFCPARRGDSTWTPLSTCLMRSSARYGRQASLLVVNLCQARVEDSELVYSEFAGYDLGQAVAHLTVQAASMGLSCRQFRAFDRDAVSALLQVPPHWEVTSMTAVGRALGERSDAIDRVPDVRWPRPR